MITITMVPGPIPKAAPPKQNRSPPQTDIATATWNGQPFQARSASGATMALARQLLAAGCPDQPWLCLNADGQPILRGKSLHRLATLTLKETDRGLSFGRYQERPDFSTGNAKNRDGAPSEG